MVSRQNKAGEYLSPASADRRTAVKTNQAGTIFGGGAKNPGLVSPLGLTSAFLNALEPIAPSQTVTRLSRSTIAVESAVGLSSITFTRASLSSRDFLRLAMETVFPLAVVSTTPIRCLASREACSRFLMRSF